MTDVFRTFSVIQNPFLPSGIITCPTTGIQRDMSRSLPTGLMSSCESPYIRGRNFHHHHTPSVPQVENQRFLVLIMELLLQQARRIFQRQPTIATPIQMNGLPVEPFLIEGSFQPGVQEFKQQGIFHQIVCFYIFAFTIVLPFSIQDGHVPLAQRGGKVSSLIPFHIIYIGLAVHFFQ